MNPLHHTALCLALAATSARAQDRPTDPMAGRLVKCGTEQVAVFGGTESKDNRYALGWTIRPQLKKTPVDWSTYDPNEPVTWINQYPISGDDSPGDYVVVDGLLDLRAKKFTPLPTKYPMFAHQNRRSLGVAWSDEKHGVRRALIDLDNDWSSFTLLLADVGSHGTHYVDLKPAADHAVSAFVRRQTPHSYKRYVFGYGDFAGKGTSVSTDPMKVHFLAQVPKMDDPSYEGDVMATFPEGKITGVTGKKSAQ